MNKGLLILNIILLVAVGVLFFLFLNGKDNTATNTINRSPSDSAAKWQHIPVAYFDMDSVEANFSLFKQMQTEVVKREAGINDTINQMRKAFQNYYQKLQARGAHLSPQQRDSLGHELAQMDMEIKNRATELYQTYQAYYMS